MSDVVLSYLPPELGDVLESDFDARVRGVGGRVELRVREKQVSEVLRLGLGVGAEVVSVTPHRVSLEKIFLEAVSSSSSELIRHGSGEKGELS